MSFKRDECQLNDRGYIWSISSCLLQHNKFHLSLQNFEQFSKIVEVWNQETGGFIWNGWLSSLYIFYQSPVMFCLQERWSAQVQRGWIIFVHSRDKKKFFNKRKFLKTWLTPKFQIFSFRTFFLRSICWYVLNLNTCQKSRVTFWEYLSKWLWKNLQLFLLWKQKFSDVI